MTAQAANDFNNVLFKEIDSNQRRRSAMQRQLVAGKTIKIGGNERSTSVDGSADEINRIFHQAMPDVDFDLIDTDFASVAHRYIKSLERTVGIIGGIKKVLGSKSGLVTALGDESFARHHHRRRHRHARLTVRPRRVESATEATVSSRRCVRCVTTPSAASTSIGGSVRCRDPRRRRQHGHRLGATARRTRRRSCNVRSSSRIRWAVGKYHERFRRLTVDIGHGAGRPGSIDTRVRNCVARCSTRRSTALAKRFRTLEKQLGKLQADAAAEARRIEAQGNVGATPIQDELRRVAAEQGSTSIDMDTGRSRSLDRLDVNQAAQGVIDARLGDQDFINLAVADDLSPKSPGSPTATATRRPAGLCRSGTRRRSRPTSTPNEPTVLGADDPQVAEVAARFEVANKRSGPGPRRNEWRARINYGDRVDTAHERWSTAAL